MVQWENYPYCLKMIESWYIDFPKSVIMAPLGKEMTSNIKSSNFIFLWGTGIEYWLAIFCSLLKVSLSK